MSESRVTTLKLSTLSQAEKHPVHFLPCEIEHNREANVDRYFIPAINKNKNEMTVSFRGRALKGQEINLPQGYTGLVLKEDHRPISDEEDRTLRVKSTFNSLTYWNLETQPTTDDTIVMAMNWPDIAAAIHGAVED
ncbi:ribonuclease H2 subunit C [Erpetoichthys calabaricus]|uniref:ribonuclease H2 subunit C n=1 Tax=Erpetoichthys calabaricus TaxID=27687 RepID=UPI002234D00F|nr:ribonuclease H2 subunit C [Erpetoichthys calabaricus]